jgi:hypothetical protein
VQAFINTSFENITSTEHALSLLAQFNAILQRDKLKEELDAKYQVWKVSGWLSAVVTLLSDDRPCKVCLLGGVSVQAYAVGI